MTTPTKRGRPMLDLTGQRFGKWTVIERAGTYRNEPTWRCRCACGAERTVLGNRLRGGHSTQCKPCWLTEMHEAVKGRSRKVGGYAALLREAAAALPPGELRDRIVAALGTEGER